MNTLFRLVLCAALLVASSLHSLAQYTRTSSISTNGTNRYTVIANPVSVNVTNPGATVTLYFGYASGVWAGTRSCPTGSSTHSLYGGIVDLAVSPSSTAIELQQRADWSGLNATSASVTAAVTGSSATLFFRWGTSGAVFTAAHPLPSSTVTVNYATSAATYAHFNSPVAFYDLTANSTVVVVPPVVAPTTLEKFFGKDLTVPYYVEGGQDTVEVKIGGQTYTFPVEYAEGDTGGIAMLKLPIPQGWDGSAEIGGVKVALAPRTAYTGEPTMAATANPYDDAYPATLPAGMTRGIPDLPSGMTPGTYYGLPSGVSESTKLPLPSGVTQIKSGPAVGGNLTTAVTNSTGAKQWTATSSSNVSTGTTGGTTGSTSSTVGGTGTSKEGSGTTGTEDGDKAVLDASMGAPDEDVKPGSAMSGYANQWESLKGQVQNKLGGFRPLQTGSIPKSTSLAMSFDFGPLGNRNVNFDLTQEPFVTARLLALVFVTFWAGMWFLNFIKI